MKTERKTRTKRTMKKQLLSADQAYRERRKARGEPTAHEKDRAIVKAFADVLGDWQFQNLAMPLAAMPDTLRRVLDTAALELRYAARKSAGPDVLLPDMHKLLTDYLLKK